MDFAFSAESTFGSPYEISGIITANLVAGSSYEYQISSISGSLNGAEITGLSNYGTADNDLFFPGDPNEAGNGYLDFSGLSFTTPFDSYNIFYASNQQIYGVENATNTSIVTFDVAPVCYAMGTRIETVRGMIAVEDLQVGDMVVTASGACRPIRWLGHRTIDCHRHPRMREVMPVRIAAHAFGECRPARDLTVSPGHSLCVDVLGEVLIPAGALTNGSTIIQEDVDTVTYWHVELDTHDLILAENLPAESYLEVGNRDFFAENGVVALEAAPDVTSAIHADFCRPFHAEGALVEAVRSQLSARAVALGWRLEEQGLGDLHLRVGGVRVEPVIEGMTARFTLPAGASEVWLVSAAVTPDEVGMGADRRMLGVGVGSLTFSDDVTPQRFVLADDPRLREGFHGVEPGPQRWTNGCAKLPAELWADYRGAVSLRVDLTRPALPRWVAPRTSGIELAA